MHLAKKKYYLIESKNIFLIKYIIEFTNKLNNFMQNVLLVFNFIDRCQTYSCQAVRSVLGYFYRFLSSESNHDVWIFNTICMFWERSMSKDFPNFECSTFLLLDTSCLFYSWCLFFNKIVDRDSKRQILIYTRLLASLSPMYRLRHTELTSTLGAAESKQSPM